MTGGPHPDRPAGSSARAPAASPRGARVIVVMPAYNAAATLEATYRDIPPGAVAEVILVDDASRDGTADLARRLGLTTLEHPRNRGYGGNQKTCYGLALERGADVIVMIHPDYQYDARLVPLFVGFVESGVCDVVLGNRVRSRAETLAGGMPLYKYLFNRFLTILENVVLGQNLGDFHSGFRVYNRRVLETVPWRENSDDFVFDSQFLAQAAYFGFRIGDAPIPCRYFPEASSINVRRSITYGLSTLWTLGEFALAKAGIHRGRRFLNAQRPGPLGSGNDTQ